MTTILACRSVGMMVADSRCTFPSGRFLTRKMVQTPGRVLGTAGDSPDTEKFISWYTRCKVYPVPEEFELGQEFEALELDEKGLRLFVGSALPIEIEDDFFAVGSGSPAALGALRAMIRAGRTLDLQAMADAVDIACDVDAASGRPIRWLPPGSPHVDAVVG